jgi:hypothetical protein
MNKLAIIHYLAVFWEEETDKRRAVVLVGY